MANTSYPIKPQRYSSNFNGFELIKAAMEETTTAEMVSGQVAFDSATGLPAIKTHSDALIQFLAAASSGQEAGIALLDENGLTPVNKLPNVENLTIGGDINMGNRMVSGLVAPTSGDHAANKAYVDQKVESGTQPLGSVVMMFTDAAQLPALGDTVSQDFIKLDGTIESQSHTYVAGDRVLINSSNLVANGVFEYAADGSTFRPTNADSEGNLAGGTVWVSLGEYGQKQYLCLIEASGTPDSTLQTSWVKNIDRLGGDGIYTSLNTFGTVLTVEESGSTLISRGVTSDVPGLNFAINASGEVEAQRDDTFFDRLADLDYKTATAINAERNVITDAIASTANAADARSQTNATNLSNLTTTVSDQDVRITANDAKISYTDAEKVGNIQLGNGPNTAGEILDLLRNGTIIDGTFGVTVLDGSGHISATDTSPSEGVRELISLTNKGGSRIGMTNTSNDTTWTAGTSMLGFYTVEYEANPVLSVLPNGIVTAINDVYSNESSINANAANIETRTKAAFVAIPDGASDHVLDGDVLDLDLRVASPRVFDASGNEESVLVSIDPTTNRMTIRNNGTMTGYHVSLIAPKKGSVTEVASDSTAWV